jgi:mono/diheme cytochrome c family protein
MKNKIQTLKLEIRDTKYDEFENSIFFKLLQYLYRLLKIVFSKIFILLLLSATLTSCQSEEKIKLEQYYIGGKEIYEQNCANCHQKDGKGLQNLYPPIAGSDFLKNKDKVIWLIKNGSKDTISVNGKTFSQPMPANIHLQNLDIAEVVTYIYNEWKVDNKITEVSEVEKVLNKN